MTSIIIYTTPEKLLHKQDKLKGDKDKSNCGTYYWNLQALPKRLKEEDKIYFAVKGFIVGYFLIQEILPYGEPYAKLPYNSITFQSKTWKDIEPIPTSSFQGFKYADKVEGLE